MTGGEGNTIQSYIPPHPQSGTPYHRYTFILYEQPGKLAKGIIPQREHFQSREFAREHGLTARGVHFYRQVWDETVSKVYADVLRTCSLRIVSYRSANVHIAEMPEPKYGRARKATKYSRMA